MGQGACQGIEDAYYISNMLANTSSYVEAFSHFEKFRRKKVDYIVNTSWRFGQMAHSPIGQAFLRLVMKSTPSSVITQQMQKVYAIEDEGNII